MTENLELAIMIDFDGDDRSGVYELYPANEESEPDFCWSCTFHYCTQGTADYDSRDEARAAAEAEAGRVAARIGGTWFSNE